jgi:hypothetical protein
LAKRKDKAAPASQQHLTFFEPDYGHDMLRVTGPVFIAEWSAPLAIIDVRKQQNLPIPTPVSGILLLDTGASITCISLKAADELGLTPTRMASGYGASGPTHNPIFFARLQISIAASNRRTDFAWEQEVQGVPDLEKQCQVSYAGVPRELVGLLGRDILRHCRVKYDGILGKVRIEFDMRTLTAPNYSSS